MTRPKEITKIIYYSNNFLYIENIHRYIIKNQFVFEFVELLFTKVS